MDAHEFDLATQYVAMELESLSAMPADHQVRDQTHGALDEQAVITRAVVDAFVERDGALSARSRYGLTHVAGFMRAR